MAYNIYTVRHNLFKTDKLYLMDTGKVPDRYAGIAVASITPKGSRIHPEPGIRITPIISIKPMELKWKLYIPDIPATVPAPDMNFPNNINYISMIAGYLIKDILL